MSGNSSIMSSVFANRATRTFTATACGIPGQEPTSTQSLTDDQASKGLQLFFRSQNGYVDATYTVSSVSSSCTGGNLLFAGDSALCAPPPPTPPGLPPSPLPPSLPPPWSPPPCASVWLGGAGTWGARLAAVLA